MITNVFTNEYKTQILEYVELLNCLVQKGGTTTDERVEKVSELTESYFTRVGGHADYTILEKLSDLILYDDLVKHNPHKMTVDEYPIMSERQEKRRYLREVSEVWSATVATDGNDYRVKTRDSNRKLREMGL